MSVEKNRREVGGKVGRLENLKLINGENDGLMQIDAKLGCFQFEALSPGGGP